MTLLPAPTRRLPDDVWTVATVAASALLTYAAARWAATRSDSVGPALAVAAVALFMLRRFATRPGRSTEPIVRGLQFLGVTAVAALVGATTAMPARIELARFILTDDDRNGIFTAFVLVAAVLGYALLLVGRVLIAYYRYAYWTDDAKEAYDSLDISGTEPRKPPHRQAGALLTPAVIALALPLFLVDWPGTIVAQAYWFAPVFTLGFALGSLGQRLLKLRNKLGIQGL